MSNPRFKVLIPAEFVTSTYMQIPLRMVRINHPHPIRYTLNSRRNVTFQPWLETGEAGGKLYSPHWIFWMYDVLNYFHILLFDCHLITTRFTRSCFSFCLLSSRFSLLQVSVGVGNLPDISNRTLYAIYEIDFPYSFLHTSGYLVSVKSSLWCHVSLSHRTKVHDFCATRHRDSRSPIKLIRLTNDVILQTSRTIQRRHRNVES